MNAPEVAPPTPSDTPPAEYLYLDSDRVLAYLGQIENGLTATEKRTESETQTASASLKGGPLAEVSGSAQRQTSLEEIVTPAAADRFFSLLIKLRTGTETRNDQSTSWLRSIDAGSTRNEVLEGLKSSRVGDFLRIYDARLFLPPYAAAAPRARYALSYLGGNIAPPRRPLYAPISQKEDRTLTTYLAGLGPDPMLPFVLPAPVSGTVPDQRVLFLVPARYLALLDNARLLNENLTVVGKVAHMDLRTAGTADCKPPTDQSAGSSFRPCEYRDRQTMATFVPALRRAPAMVLRAIGMDPDHRRRILRSVRGSARFASPVVVLLPIAIYE